MHTHADPVAPPSASPAHLTSLIWRIPWSNAHFPFIFYHNLHETQNIYLLSEMFHHRSINELFTGATHRSGLWTKSINAQYHKKNPTTLQAPVVNDRYVCSRWTHDLRGRSFYPIPQFPISQWTPPSIKDDIIQLLEQPCAAVAHKRRSANP